ncbi:hypothetical protein BPY_09230 [Bifidobacterium psychraerophilum]
MALNANKLDAELAHQDGQEYGALFKLKEDQSATKVDCFIREFSLDEVPQFSQLAQELHIAGWSLPSAQYGADLYSNLLFATLLLVRQGLTRRRQISERSDLSKEDAEHLEVRHV